MSIGYRPKGSDGPIYNPERDYAYITPTLMRSAIERLDANDIPDDIKTWKQDNEISEAEIVAVSEALARAQRDFVNAADPVESFEQALRRRDFYDVRYPVRQFLFASIGEVFCAAWFVAVREVSKIGADSPAARGMSEFTAAVHKFVNRVLPGSYNLEPYVLQLRNDVLETQCALLFKECRALQQEIHTLKESHKVVPTIVVPPPSTIVKLIKPILSLFGIPLK